MNGRSTSARHSLLARPCLVAVAFGVAVLVALVLTPRGASATPARTTAQARGLPLDVRIGAQDSHHEHSLSRTATRLVQNLGTQTSGGAYLDPSTGRLVVTVADAGGAAVRTVRNQDARVEPVTYSLAQLDRVQHSLNQFAESHGAGKAQGWYVDVSKNRVVITVGDGASNAATAAFLDHARSFGSRVDVTHTHGRPRTAAALYGGRGVHLSNGLVCTDGFNARTASGDDIFLTAGHCAYGRLLTWRNRTRIGYVRGYRFPGHDFAAVTIRSPQYWHPQGAVDMHNGYARLVRGTADPVVGSTVCKSGRATGWTCGVIRAKNQTVNYGHGRVVYGLVRHTACVEPGDSGGSTMVGNYAVGLTSGAQFYQRGGSIVCGRKVGRRNVSFYQPIRPVLKAFGATLITR